MTHLFKAAFTALMLLAALPAAAATITRGGDAVMGCRFSLDGQIQEGDAAALRAIFEADGYPADYSPVGRRLCLNSAGGLLREALMMADLLGEFAYGTAVPEGASCKSACAVMFLAGRYRHPEAGGAFSEDRVMHPKAQLGFHAPSLLLGDRSYSRDEVDTAYAIALDSMAGVLRHRAEMRTSIPDSLFLTLLGTPPFEMSHVETVGQAARWRIGVMPVAFPDGAPTEALAHACWNVDSGLLDYSLADFQPFDLTFTFEELSDGALFALSNRTFRYEGSARCELRLHADGGPSGNAGAAFYTGGATDQDVSGQVQTYALYPHDRRLATLPVWREGQDGNAAAFFRAARDPSLVAGGVGGFNACRLTNAAARVINVNDFVNLRADAGLRAPVVGQLRLAAQVQVPDIGRLLPLRDSARGNDCLAICDGLTAYPDSRDLRQQAEGCIAENMLWYEVVGPDGASGYVSRQFLSE